MTPGPRSIRARRRRVPLVVALACLLASPPHRPFAAETAGSPETLPVLVQSACLDAQGRVVPGLLPFEPDCTRRRPLGVGEDLPYRKHDWPGAGMEAALPRGWQASDSLLGTLRGQRAAIQTADFGDPPRRFGQIDPGDGGAALPLGAPTIAGAMTEDGTRGVQWFASAACTPGGAVMQAPGWLYALLPLRPGAWNEVVARIGRAPEAEACARGTIPVLTSWRLERMAVPWREAADGRTGSVEVETLVSEHFGNATIAGSGAMERVFRRGTWARCGGRPGKTGM